MATKTGKPQAGDRVRVDFVILGNRETTWEGTVVAWPAHGRVKIRVDRVTFDPKDQMAAVRRYKNSLMEYDEYAAAMYLSSGLIQVIADAPKAGTRLLSVVIGVNSQGRVDPFLFEDGADAERFATNFRLCEEVVSAVVYHQIDVLGRGDAFAMNRLAQQIKELEGGADGVAS